jgi:predicted nucleotidyltransferase
VLYASAVVTAKQIITAVDAIAVFYKPLSIRLFGSYAYGTPNADSDVDLLVLKNFIGTPHSQFVKVRMGLDVAFPLDLLVRRPAVVQHRIRYNDFFLREVMEKAIVLYDAGDAGPGEKGRRRLRRHLAAGEVKSCRRFRDAARSSLGL